VILLRLTPDGFTLGLNFADRAEHGDRTVENAQRTLHFGSEVHVSGSVDDIDTMVLPVTGGGGAGDRDAAFPFLFHPVHGGAALVDFAQLVIHAGVEENAFTQRGLAGVDVRHDTNVTIILQRGLAIRRLMILFFFLLGHHNSVFPAHYQR